jgi:hypothetical protein
LGANEILAAHYLALLVKQGKLPATVLAFALGADDGRHDIERAVQIDWHIRVEQIIALRSSGIDDRAGERIAGGQIVIFEKGVAELSGAGLDAVESGAGAGQADVLQGQHVDVGAMIIALADRGAAAVQEIQAFRFDVGFQDVEFGA